jgi:hypothetical protein
MCIILIINIAKLKDENGNTPAMLCIIHGKEIEEWMKHDPAIQNNEGNT